MRTVAVLFFFFLCLTGYCCINENRVLLNGDIITADRHASAPTGKFNPDDKEYLERVLRKTDSLYKVTGRIADYSDYGVALIYNGRYEEAKKIFTEIEFKRPGLYPTAANLGTVYELLGMNDSAYYWINKGIEINPSSHFGSEWIHVEILKAKIASKGNPNYYYTHNILNIDMGTEETPINVKHIDLKELETQLYYQLTERMSFVKAPDPVVAQLLFELGNISAITKDVESALVCYKRARTYGYSSDLMEKREEHFKALQSKAEFRENVKDWIRHNFFLVCTLLGFGLILFIGAAILLFRRRKRKLAIRSRK